MEKNGNSIGHKKWDKQPRQLGMMKYAYQIRGWDYMLTLNAENGRRQLDRQSDWKNKYGVRERSFGLCQLMEIYHAPFIWKTGRTETKRKGLYRVDIAKATAGGHTDAFLDYKKQIEYCAKVWDDAIEKGKVSTTFYGYNHRFESNNGFYMKKM